MTDTNGGHFGPWTVPGPALAVDEIRALAEGTEVEVVWSGGNGPGRSVVVFDARGEPYLVPTHADPKGPLRYYNPVGDFVGPRPRTEIRMATSGQPEPAADRPVPLASS